MIDMKSPNIALIAGLVVALASCSFSTGTTPEKAGEEVIEGALSEQGGLVYVDAKCVAPATNEVGETFTCSALTEAGETVTFEGVLDPDDSIFVAPSNIIGADDMAMVETEAAGLLGEDIGVVIDPTDADCPDETTVLVNDQLQCVITDVSSNERYEMILTATDFVPREGYGSRFYEIGDLLD
jgi:hypothetical protein